MVIPLVVIIMFLSFPSVLLATTLNIFLGDSDVKQHAQILKGLTETLREESPMIESHVHRIVPGKSLNQFKAVKKSDLVVFIGDTPIYEFKEMRSKIGVFNSKILVVGSLAGRNFQSKRSSNTFLIDYDVPIISSINIIRNILEAPVKRVGVVHGWAWDPLVKRNRELLAQEGVDLLTIRLNKKQLKSAKVVKASVQNVIQQGVDVLWIPNDSSLLSVDNLVNAWVPIVRSSNLPIVVGVEQLMYTRYNFGTIVIEPNSVELGVQVAYMVYDLLDPMIEEPPSVQLPISISKGVNVKLLKSRSVDFKAEGLSIFDHIIQ